MRRLRHAVVGLCTFGLVSVATAVVAGHALAATAPAAPYNALVLDGHQGSWLLSGTLSFDSSNATMAGTPESTAGLVFNAFNADHDWSLSTAPPSGSAWQVGKTYSLADTPDATDAELRLDGDSRGCDAQPGSMTVVEAQTDGSGNLTAFAASFTIGCESTAPAVSGEVRWNSSVGYVGAVTSAYSLAFGSQQVARTGTQQTVTLTSTGSQPVTFGAASLIGTDPGDFAITGNACTGNSLGYGQTCTVAVTATPTMAGDLSAYLDLADNSASGHKYVHLSETGTDWNRLTSSASSVDFGLVDVGNTGGPRTVTFTAHGTVPIHVGVPAIDGTDASVFSITSNSCALAVLTGGSTCTISVTAHPTTFNDKNAQLSVPSSTLTATVPLHAIGNMGAAGTYYPISPSRLLDTRSGVGAPKTPLGPGGVLHLQVLGRGGVPANGAGTAVLNVTVVSPTAGGYLTVYPDGVTRPTASSINFPAGWVGANSVTATVGSDGKVAIYNSSGNTNVVVDVVGYYANSDAAISTGHGVGGQLQPVQPKRLLDTRNWGTKLQGGHYVDISVDFGAAENDYVRALVVNVTAVSASAGGYLTTWNGLAGQIPTASTLNYTPGAVVPNLAIVPTAPCQECGLSTGLPTIGVYTSASTHVLVDIVGFFDIGSLPDGLRFQPMTPKRIVDSRTGLGLPTAIGPGATATVTAPGSVLSGATEALALNVTAVAPTSGTYLTVWPDGITGVGQPEVSNLNPARGQVVANGVVTALGPAHAFDIYNRTGTTNVVVDVVGSFYLYSGTASSAAAKTRISVPSISVNSAN